MEEGDSSAKAPAGRAARAGPLQGASAGDGDLRAKNTTDVTTCASPPTADRAITLAGVGTAATCARAAGDPDALRAAGPLPAVVLACSRAIAAGRDGRARRGSVRATGHRGQGALFTAGVDWTDGRWPPGGTTVPRPFPPQLVGVRAGCRASGDGPVGCARAASGARASRSLAVRVQIVSASRPRERRVMVLACSQTGRSAARRGHRVGSQHGTAGDKPKAGKARSAR